MLLSRRELIRLGAAATATAMLRPLARCAPAEFKFDPEKNLISAPSDPALWAPFRRDLAAWRAARRRELNYSDALYRRPEFAWARSNFACCFLMLCDETFYHAKAGRYLVKEFLAHGRREFGGYDSVVLWHAYPRIGLDDRNQFDFYRDMPGGLQGLRAVVGQFHRQGVRVYIDYNPWDTATRREGGEDLAALAEMVGALGADGIFLDTMDRGAAGFRARLDAVRPGVVLEGEGALPVDRIADHHLSWAQWFGDSAAPGVLRNKWFERRHMQHQIDRWNRDHSTELHQAWMNGSGMMVWENVFGAWVGWSERDRALLRALLPIQRRYADLFTGEGWTPLTPTLQPQVYASLWEGHDLRLWTLVNRSNAAVQGPLLRAPANDQHQFFDLIQGTKAKAVREQGSICFSGAVPARGIGCFLAGPLAALGSDFQRFLDGQRKTQARACWDTTFPEIRPRLTPVSPTAKQSTVPEGMAAIPAASLTLKVQFRSRECAYYESTHPHAGGAGHLGLHRPIWFERPIKLTPYAIDLTLVTNAQFAQFLKASRYRPRQAENFLKHWLHGAPPPGKEDHPVVYVDLNDARAYARWAGRRLPTEEEWQFAAQGPQGLAYPWGNQMAPDRCNDGATGGTTAVRAFPAGRSPFGLYDMCGNVWHWTESERSDGRTRFVILRGGSFYRRGGSDWYFDEGPKPASFAAKMLLMWPGLDRCANIGFRCAVDLA